MWIHAASGEFEYAKPVIQLLKLKYPDIPILVTYFSPTYKRQIEVFPGVDLACALPLDLKAPLQQFFRFYRPRLLLIARTDLWPEMLAQAQRFQVPSVLFSATVADLGGFKRRIKNFTLSQLSTIFCVSDADRRNIKTLNFDLNGEVIGDTRYDQVMARLAQPKKIKSFLFPEPRPVLIAGSTWPEDEAVLIKACAPLISEKMLRLILVPHEVTKESLTSLFNQLDQAGLQYQRYSQVETPSADVVVVDVIGILAELYSVADLAFVGGSFKRGVHSVMEPLAAGLLTAVGPRNQNNREAAEFMKLTPKDSNITAVTEIKSSHELADWIQSAIALPSFPKQPIKKAVEAKSKASEKLVERLSVLYKSQMTQE